MNKFDFKTSDGSNIYFTSDLHFNHSNVIHFSNRPFSSIEEMNEKLIENWNNTIKDTDIVFNCGDIFWKDRVKATQVLNRLKGKHYLILGNHDYGFINSEHEQYFEKIEREMRISIEGQEIWLSHFPLLCFSHSYNDYGQPSWNLFGHVHSPYSGIDLPRLSYLFPNQYDVGIDNNNYTPVSFYKVKEIINSNYERGN